MPVPESRSIGDFAAEAAPTTVVDLEAGDLTLADLDLFVPQTRAEAKAALAARARLERAGHRVDATSPARDRRGSAIAGGAREVSAAGEKSGAEGGRQAAASRHTRRSERPSGGRHGSPARRGALSVALATTNRPRQAAAFLVLVGVLGAVQASAAGGTEHLASGGSLTARTGATTGMSLLALPETGAALGAASRSARRTALPAADATAVTDQQTSTTEQQQRRADAVTAQVEAQAAASAAPSPSPSAAADSAGTAVFTHPVEAEVVSPFGYRVHPITGVWTLHKGIDLAADCGVVVHAAGGGTVVESGWMSGYGWRIVIDHGTIDGHNIRTTYNHLSRRDADVGDKVSAGQAIALVGTTGNSTGCHLHFEVEKDQTPVDPMSYL